MMASSKEFAGAEADKLAQADPQDNAGSDIDGADGRERRPAAQTASSLFGEFAQKSRHFVEWSLEDDAALIKATQNFPMRKNSINWSRIAAECGLSIPRTAKQCRERFQNHLDPKLNRSPWQEDEDNLIIDLQAQHGNSWAAISRALGGGRTEHSVKNRFICLKKVYGLKENKVGRKRSRSDELRMQEFVARHRAAHGIDNRETKLALKDEEAAEVTVESLLFLSRNPTEETDVTEPDVDTVSTPVAKAAKVSDGDKRDPDS